MPQFNLGEQKTAKLSTLITPSGLSCSAELFLTKDGVTKVTTSNKVQFTSTGSEQLIQLPITMPQVADTYLARILIMYENTQLGAYQATDNITIIEETLKLTAVNMLHYLWSGSIIEVSTGRKQSWGLCNIELQPVILEPLVDRQILLEYVAGSGQAVFGPFLVTSPKASGSLVWNGVGYTLGGVSSRNLTTTNNKQILRCTFPETITNYYTPPVGISLYNIRSSKDVAGYENVGKYFIGQNIQGDTSFAIGPGLKMGDDVEVCCSLGVKNYATPNPPYSLSIPRWYIDWIRLYTDYPESAYVFNTTGSTLQDDELTLYILGNVSPFRLAFTIYTEWYVPPIFPINIKTYYIHGPISNYKLTLPKHDISSSYQNQQLRIFVNPDPVAILPDIPGMEVMLNWRLLFSYSLHY